MIARLSGLAILAGVFASCAGGVDQSSACASYVACIEARDDAMGIETNLERFRASGDCWGSEEGGELCTKSCERGLEFYAEQAGAPGECAP